MKNIVKRLFSLLSSMMLLLVIVSCSTGEPQLGKASVKKVVTAMTLEEKAYFVTGTGMRLEGLIETDNSAVTPGAPVVGQVQSIVPGAAGTTYEILRLGIPAMVLADGPAGLRISPVPENDENTYYCTAFPVATLLASTWDTDLVYRTGQSIGKEVLEYGVDVLLAPGMNIHRNPLCGRNFEYYSEDPLLTGKMAAAMVSGVQSQGVGTSIKHYAANNTETNRNALNAIVSERALREIYLEGFRIAVEEAKPWTVMSSYNLINGTYAPESHDLITKVLRDDWGFKGYVMTDWFGGSDPVAMMKAGNDLLMPGTSAQAEAILAAVKDGTLDEDVLDKNVERILNIMLETPRFKKYQYSNTPDMDAHAQVTRQVAAEGMVLLKNENAALPLGENIKHIAAFGNTSYEIITGGAGSGDVNEAYSVSLVEGLTGSGYTINTDLQDTYTAYVNSAKAKLPPAQPFMPQTPVAEMTVNMNMANRMASAADAALITIGRNSGEFLDRSLEGDFRLTTTEISLIRTVSQAFRAQAKKTIVILNIGGVIEVADWRDIPDAILLAWQAGQETGNSIADVISGKVNPSGKLTSSFPVKYEDVPSSKNFPGVIVDQSQPEDVEEGGLTSFLRRRFSRIVYEEGIYVGYRYYETFNVPTAYEFGYGLSYTKFEYNNISLSSDQFAGEVTVTVDISNRGQVAGKEVVQLYLTAPAGALDKPAIELKGFAKTRLLQPGESQSLTFTLNSRSLASFHSNISAWVADAGTYEVMIGASSKDIRQTASFELANELQVKTESKALAPVESFNELQADK